MDNNERAFEILVSHATRYQWLRQEFLAGRHVDIAEGLNNAKELDDYIDHQINKRFMEAAH